MKISTFNDVPKRELLYSISLVMMIEIIAPEKFQNGLLHVLVLLFANAILLLSIDPIAMSAPNIVMTSPPNKASMEKSIQTAILFVNKSIINESAIIDSLFKYFLKMKNNLTLSTYLQFYKSLFI